MKIRSLLAVISASIACAAFTPGVAAFPNGPVQAAEIRFSGGVWRGSIGDRIEVTFRESGRDQTLVGTLSRLDRFALTLDTEIGGRVVKKVIVLGDVRSVKPVDDAAASSGSATSSSAAASTGGAWPGAGNAASADDHDEDRDDPGINDDYVAPLSELPDTAGPITGPRSDGKKTLFILPLNGTVGIGLRHQEMERLEKEADKLGPGQIIVMRINSPGGLVSEAVKIKEVLNRIKSKHRLVAWIEEAISGGAYTALFAEEMYFMDVGSLGAITKFAGAESSQGADLDAWLREVYEVGQTGSRDGHVIRCMVYSPLECSYDVDEATGKVTWHRDTSGKYVLSVAGDNLVFNATDAVRSKFAQGRANNEFDLVKAMQLQDGTYVVSHAGKRFAQQWQRLQDQAAVEVPRLLREYELKGTSSGNAETVLGIRINAVKKLISWWNRAPNALFRLQVPPKQVLEEHLRNLQKQMSDLQRAKQRERRG